MSLWVSNNFFSFRLQSTRELSQRQSNSISRPRLPPKQVDVAHRSLWREGERSWINQRAVRGMSAGGRGQASGDALTHGCQPHTSLAHWSVISDESFRTTGKVNVTWRDVTHLKPPPPPTPRRGMNLKTFIIKVLLNKLYFNLLSTVKATFSLECC